MQSKQKDNSKPFLNADQPLESIAEDKLGRGEFVKNITETIIEYKNTDPLIIGLYGKWGYGKSTILNFVKEHINNITDNADDKQKELLPEILTFNPWIFANQEELIKRFLEWFLYEMKGEDRKEKNKKIIEKLQNWLDNFTLVEYILSKKNLLIVLGILASMGISFSGFGLSEENKVAAIIGIILLVITLISGLAQDVIVNVLNRKKRKIKEVKTLIELRDELKKELKSINNRIVIIIDEIDRLTEEETKCIFQLAKATFNLPNLVFILAFDNKQVAKLISKDTFDGEEYINKIIQLPIVIPRPDNQDFEKFLVEEVNKAIKIIPPRYWDNDWWNDLYNSGLKSILTKNENPRKIIRIFNSIIANVYSIQDKINIPDYIAISTIQILYPELYKYIYSNKYFFVDMEVKNLIEAFEYDDNESKIKNENEEVLNKYGIDVSNLTKKLFPKLEAGYSKGINDELYRKRRISSPNCFEIYYYHKLPKGETNQTDLEYFVQNLEKANEYYDVLEKHLRDYSLPNFLNALSSYKNEIPKRNISNLTIALFSLADKFPKEYSTFLFSPDNTVQSLIRNLIKRFDKYQGTGVFRKALSESSGVYMPCYLLNNWQKNFDDNKLDEIEIQEKDLSELKKICTERIEHLFDKHLLLKVRYLDFVLDNWKKWTLKKHKFDTFIDNTINDKDLLPNLLEYYVRDRYTSSSKEYKFNFKSLSEIGTNMEKVNSQVQYIKSIQNLKITNDQLRAIKLYFKDYPYYREKGIAPDKWHRDDDI